MFMSFTDNSLERGYSVYVMMCFLMILDIDQLLTINGMIIRLSPLIPEMREAFFRCYVCKNTVTVEIERGRIAEPTLCTHCQTNHSYQMIHNRSQFTDKQMVKLQEAPGILLDCEIWKFP